MTHCRRFVLFVAGANPRRIFALVPADNTRDVVEFLELKATISGLSLIVLIVGKNSQCFWVTYLLQKLGDFGSFQSVGDFGCFQQSWELVQFVDISDK